MILYLDASALVKRYVKEEGSTAVAKAIQEATYVGTAAITRAETVAALAKAARVGTVTREEAHSAVQQFRFSAIPCTYAPILWQKKDTRRRVSF
jgi:predicted nucleic acid-binding protein